METKPTAEIPEEMEQVRQELENWRSSQPRRSRIPKPLWASAVKLAKQYGLWRTAQTLGLDYQRLKVQTGSAQTRRHGKAASAFVELAATAVGFSECTVELENRRGAKMRIHLKGVDAAGVAAISQALWSGNR